METAHIELDEEKKWQEIASTLKDIPCYKKVVKIIEANDLENPFISFFSIVHKYGIFEIFTREFVDNLSSFIEKKFGKNVKIVEVCAGDGRLSKALKEKGFNIIAVDNRSRQNPDETSDIEYPDFVINDSALNYIKNNKPELILASWIEFQDNLDIKLVETGIPLIIIGEASGGCTGTSKFWERKDFRYKKLEDASEYNISRTDSKFMMHHTSTYLVRKKAGGGK